MSVAAEHGGSRDALAGKRVVITRAEDDAAAWAGVLRQRGATPVVLPCVSIEWQDDESTRAALRAGCESADWLVLTSSRAAAALTRLGATPLPAGLRVAAVGEATAAAAQEHLGRVDLVPAQTTGKGLAAELLSRLIAGKTTGARVVVAAAAEGRRDLEDALVPAGFTVDRVAVYRTSPVTAPADPGALEGCDVVLLASPSAVTGLVSQLEVPPGIAIITIGPTTTAAALAAGLHVAAEAATPDLEALLEAIP